MAKRDKAVEEIVLIANGVDWMSAVPAFVAVTTIWSSDVTIIVSEREVVFPDSM